MPSPRNWPGWALRSQAGITPFFLARSISERDFSTINALQRAFGDFTNFIFLPNLIVVACIVCGMSREEDLNSRLIPLWPYVFSSFIAVMRGISGFGQFRESYLTLSSALDACFWNAPECCTELAPGEHVPEGIRGRLYRRERRGFRYPVKADRPDCLRY